MKCRVFHCRFGDVETVTRAASEARAWWVRFGNDLFVYSANDKWAEVGRSVASRAASAGEVCEVRKGAMHLVVQKGRTFQLEHPEIPVLFDKGRYLIVEIDQRSARRLGRREEPCFRLEPLAENSVVFELRPAPTTRRQPESGLSALIGSLDLASFENDIAQLVSHPTRLSTSTHYNDAADWAASRLSGLGYSTSIETVTVGASGTSGNVVAAKMGTGVPERRRVIVTGHLDSVNQAGGATAPAPGADDNASGATGVLEMARIMSGREFLHDLVFILFGGEEQGLHGSQQYVAGLSAEDRDAILAVINMDMIGTVNTAVPTVLLEGAPVSQAAIDRLADAAATYTDLEVQTSFNPFASDHVPFIDAGMAAVLTIEGADGANDAIHTGNDTLDRVDAAFALEILKMNVAAVAELAELSDEEHPCPGCGPPKGSVVSLEEEEQRHVLSTQYQYLFAQYLRLHREGRLQAHDHLAWQKARQIHDAFVVGNAQGRS